jgi:hypothetical protein
VKYRIEQIGDGGDVIATMDLDGFKVIPPAHTLVFNFPSAALISDIERAQAQLFDFFGDRKIIVIHGDDVRIWAVASGSTVSAEGASWAME